MVFDSTQYWKDRYLKGGTSGAGSYGILAEYKAEIINNFVKENDIKSIFDYGCGDGNQIGLFNFENYTGYDISEKMILAHNLNPKFRSRKWHFLNSLANVRHKFELTISLDVIFHLTNQKDFETYINNLFAIASKYVIIYSSNGDKLETSSVHVKDREFLPFVPKEFELMQKIDNKYPYNPKDTINTSISDFYIFKQK